MIFALFLFVCIIGVVYIVMYCAMVMETFGRDLEKISKLSENLWQSFDESEYEEQISWINTENDLAKEDAKLKVENLKSKLFEDSDKPEKVQEFIRNNCSEPIEWVDKIVPFNELVQILIKSAEDQNLSEVKENIEQWNAKDKRIYELPAYKELIEKWFILPSDVRTYYDSANREPVYHLWVDYNVKAGTEVKSMYDWKVVESWLDGWLWHKVIIEHTMPDWTKFYSLYGHLGSRDLPGIWDEVKKGMKIWEVWMPFTEENWDWEEHLHFQIMENIDSKKWYSKVEWEWNYDVLKSFGKK